MDSAHLLGRELRAVHSSIPLTCWTLPRRAARCAYGRSDLIPMVLDARKSPNAHNTSSIPPSIGATPFSLYGQEQIIGNTDSVSTSGGHEDSVFTRTVSNGRCPPKPDYDLRCTAPFKHLDNPQGKSTLFSMSSALVREGQEFDDSGIRNHVLSPNATVSMSKHDSCRSLQR